MSDLNKTQAFPIYLKNEWPEGKQLVKIESPTLQVYLKVRKWRDANGQTCYQYDLERIPCEEHHWKTALSSFRNSNEAEFVQLMGEVAGFFTRIEDKLKTVTS